MLTSIVKIKGAGSKSHTLDVMKRPQRKDMCVSPSHTRRKLVEQNLKELMSIYITVDVIGSYMNDFGDFLYLSCSTRFCSTNSRDGVQLHCTLAANILKDSSPQTLSTIYRPPNHYSFLYLL